MTKFCTTLLMIFPFIACLFAQQTTTLMGVVTEKNSGDPLISATIKVGDTGVITEFDGTYKMDLEPGTHLVEFSYVGYETLLESVTISEGETKVLDMMLSESATLLNTATVTSDKFEKPLGEVTVSLDVLKPALLENTNQTSLDGLLEKVPGVNMVGDQANIRGGSGFSYGAGSRVLLLVDDMPILQPDAGFPQWEDVPLENVAQIEVVKGAASALYGSSALNGIINVRTAYAKLEPETKFAPFFTTYFAPKNKQLKWWDDLRYETGGSISHKRKIGEKLDLVAGGYYVRNESFQDSSFTRRGRFNTNLRYRITDRLAVGINTNFNKNSGKSFFFWGGVDVSPPPTTAQVNESLLYRPGSAPSESSNLRLNIDPFITYFDRSGNRHKLQGRFYKVKNNTGTSEADQSNRSDLWYSEYQFQRNIAKHNAVLTAGLVYMGTAIQAPLYGDTSITSRNLAGYVQMNKKIGTRFNISVGLRFESNAIIAPDSLTYTFPAPLNEVILPGGEFEESRPIMRFGANYRLNPTTYLRASWGQGYRFPTVAEKYIYTLFGGIPINPNPSLESETGWTGEIGIKKGFRIGTFDGFVDLVGFWSEYQNMMEFTFVGLNFGQLFGAGFQSQNIGNTRIKGMEFSVTGQGKLFGQPTTLLTGYTFIDPKFKSFDPQGESGSEGKKNADNSSVDYNILKYRYKHTFKFDMETQLQKLSIGVAAFYNSNMEAVDGIFEAFIVPGLKQFRDEHSGGTWVLNARAAYQFTDYARLSLILNNVTNTEYTLRPGKLEAPRHLTARFDFKF